MKIRAKIKLLQQIVLVDEVAHCASIRQASVRQGLKQSNLSKQISEFEEKLGYPLFIRDKKGVRLNEAGEKMMKKLEQIRPDLDRIFQFIEYAFSDVILFYLPEDISLNLEGSRLPVVITHQSDDFDVGLFEQKTSAFNEMELQDVDVSFPWGKKKLYLAFKSDCIGAKELVDFISRKLSS